MSQNTEKTSGDDPGKAAPKISLAANTGKTRGAVPGPIDPPWFRVDLFAGATVTTSGRTPPDDQGLFATQLLFTLADGTTREACIETVNKALAEVVPTLTREEGKDGRVTLRGSNADYEVTMICGEAKGKPTAYVAYRWLRPPPAPAADPGKAAATAPATAPATPGGPPAAPSP